MQRQETLGHSRGGRRPVLRSLLLLVAVVSAAALSGAYAQSGRGPGGQSGGTFRIPPVTLKTTHIKGNTAVAGGLEPKYYEPDNRKKRKLPPVPEGPFIRNPRPSPPTNVQVPGRAGVQADTDNLSFVRNVALGAAGHNNFASSTGEPSVATSGNTVFYTGNWYASLSTNGGASFQYVDPFTFFGNTPGGLDFCCDQVVHYAPQVDLFFWLLQYSEDANNNNAYRLAYGTTQQISNNQWRVVDLHSGNLGLNGVFMDFPDLAVSNNNVYLTFNGFSPTSALGTCILRMPLNSFVSDNVQVGGFFDQGHFNFRLAQSCTDIQYFATHETTSALRVWTWPENAADATSTVVNHASYANTDNTSLTPDGFDWLGLQDHRLLGGTKAGNELWFAWGAARGGASNRPQPYIEIVRINATSKALIGQPALWTDQYAYAYAALGTNSNNEVGISYAYGGNGQFVHHAVGILTGTARLVQSVAGLHGPESNRWGDYFTIRPHTANKKLFAATGYTLQAGTGRQQGDPRFFIFGRSGDVGGGGGQITVTSPNGGENWQINSSRAITWQSSNINGNVKIELSRNGGGTFETLLAGTANDGNENWNVTGPGSGNCIIQISQASNGAIKDVSNNTFTISAKGDPLATPTGLSADATSETNINVQWTDNATGEDGYKVEFKVEGGTYQQLGGNRAPNTQSASFSDAEPGTTYFFKVRCYKGGQNSQYSNEDSATTPDDEPGLEAPSGLLAKALKKKKIRLTWQDNSDGEEGFAVEIDDGTGFREIGVVSANSTGAVVTRLKAKKFYNFRVRARKGNVNSDYSNTSGAKARK